MFSKIDKNAEVDFLYNNLSKVVPTKSAWGHRQVHMPGHKEKCKINDLIEKLKNDVNNSTGKKLNLLDKALKLKALNSEKGSLFSKMKQVDLENIIKNLKDEIKSERQEAVSLGKSLDVKPNASQWRSYKGLDYIVTDKEVYEIETKEKSVMLKLLNDQGEIVREIKFPGLNEAMYNIDHME